MRSEFQKLYESLEDKTNSVKKKILDDIASKLYFFNPKKSYYLSYIFNSIGRETTSKEKIKGAEAQEELCELYEELSASMNLTERELPNILSRQELKELFNVTTRTINRWRKQGLVADKFKKDGKKALGFRDEIVETFILKNKLKVQKASVASRVTPLERKEILEFFDRVVQAGVPKAEAVILLVEEYQRSVGTIRTILKEAEYPTPNTEAVYLDYLQNIPEEYILLKHFITKTELQTIIRDERIAALEQLDLEYYTYEEFENPKELLSNTIPFKEGKLLTKEEEAILFKQLNYYKYLAKNASKSKKWTSVEKNYKKVVEIRNIIWRFNSRLVWNIARRQYRILDLQEWVNEGQEALFRAIECFDVSKGNKFSTYATTAIINYYTKTHKKENKRMERMAMLPFEYLESTVESPVKQESLEVLYEALDLLEEREREILTIRFALEGGEPQTLREVAKKYKITAERVRQIEVKAFEKIKRSFKRQDLEIEDLLC
jgi:RNA polymerase primary sigma factor